MRRALMLIFLITSSVLYNSLTINAFDMTKNDVALDFIDSVVDGIAIKGNFSIVSVENITDFAHNQYLLYNLSPLGYIIADHKTEMVLEASFEGNSPYIFAPEGSDFFYLGPGAYFYFDGIVLISITNKESIEINEYLVIGSMEFHNSIADYSNRKIDEEQEIVENSVSLPNGWTMVTDYEYFLNLTEFPSNDFGTCSFVALSILLGYYDTFYHDDFIPNIPIYYDGNFINLIKKGTASFTGLYNIPANMWNTLPGTANELQYILTDYGHYIYVPGPSGGYIASGLQIWQTFNDYIDLYSPNLEDEYDVTMSTTNLPNKVKGLLQNDIPVALTMLSYVYTYGTQSSSGNFHTVVVYGYYNDYYMAHFGYNPGQMEFQSCIITSVSMYSIFAIDYYGSHRHSKNVTILINGIQHYVCGCGQVISPSC